ncbi:hypothetical protein ASZ78_003799 [Callipepla squamata]|uniref:UBA domain-containing protein n=1 Tax=Callipepla squamata TaxID=9009 RepID=A0A226MJQ5_CALSU|nr:hypothetical protein ASZ78_003799 [Callipepla squamata]
MSQTLEAQNFMLVFSEVSLQKATAEQIRLAQMIYDKNDADFEDKVKQLMEVTGKNQDECIVALHDCNGDVNRAINILLEGSSDTTSWETVGGKKKSLGKESSENKENREKRGDRELELKKMEWTTIKETGLQTVGNVAVGEGLDVAEGEERGGFQPKAWDYTESSATDGSGTKSEIWETGQNDADDGTGAWKNSIEEWTAEDWNEDLSETKVFTASSVPAENHVTPGQSVDMVTLLQKPVTSTQETEGNSFEASQQQTFGQALVFTNSQHSTQMASGAGSSSAVNSYSPQSLPEPSPILSQLTQRQQQQTQAVPVPPPGLESFSSQVKLREPSPVDASTAVSKMLQLPSMSLDNQAVTAHQTQQKQIKPPKRRITPASKIPASAVEMPGSADVTGLNVQFGALEFGSEPALPEFGSASSSENASQATNNSLYSKSVNDPLNTSLPISNTVQESTYTTSAITSSSLTCSSQSTSPVTTTSSYDQTSVHSRIPYQSSMAPSEQPPVAVTRGIHYHFASAFSITACGNVAQLASVQRLGQQLTLPAKQATETVSDFFAFPSCNKTPIGGTLAAFNAYQFIVGSKGECTDRAENERELIFRSGTLPIFLSSRENLTIEGDSSL